MGAASWTRRRRGSPRTRARLRLFERRRDRLPAALLADVVLELRAPLGHVHGGRRHGRITEGAHGAPGDRVADLLQGLHVLLDGLTRLHARDETQHPARALAAGAALAAGLVLVEVR